MSRSLLLLLALCSSISVFAQAPYLVKDIGNAANPQPQSSDPAAFLESGGKVFFTATTETNGREPWVHDANGTRLVRDIFSGKSDSKITRFIELTPGVVLFVADDARYGNALWRSDGTEAGTTLVKDINATSTAIAILFSHGGKVFFTNNDGITGREPWVSDGTADGTMMLFDTIPGPTSSTATVQFLRLGSTTYFFAQGGLYTTDGTPGGTSLTVPLGGYRSPATVSNGNIFFFGYDPTNGFEPWKTDGTAGGTTLIKDVRAGVNGSAPNFVSIAPTATGAVFLAYDGTTTRLWTTDGTNANTAAIEPAVTATASVIPFFPTSLGVFFYSSPNIWRTDGTNAGTCIAATVSDSASWFTEAFSKIYFLGWQGSQFRLFQMSGAANATPTVVTPDSSDMQSLTFTGGKLWMGARDATNGREPWVSDDGTVAGTHLLANLAPDPARSSRPENLTPAGALLYFHPNTPQELWRTDGTAGGTFEATDVNSNLLSPPPFAEITPYKGNVYYLHGHSEFFRVDGVNGGATKVGDFDFDRMITDGNYLYLWSWSWGRMYRSDGTAAGTVPLVDPAYPGHFAGGSDSFDVHLDAGVVWIRCNHGLYRTEGTPETTRRIYTPPASAWLGGDLVAAGGLLYSLYNSGNQLWLWRSDGTGGGSYPVKALANSTGTTFMASSGRFLYFTANHPDHGTELWRSDGTEAGTFMIKDIRLGPETSSPNAFAVMNGILYFTANDGVSGAELWKSDGTAEGTVRVADITPGAASSWPDWTVAAGGRIWFTAMDETHGMELWSSDGTEAGTLLASDIVPGASSSWPEDLTANDTHLYFTATTDETGRELWAVPLTTGTVDVTGSHVTEGHGGTRALRFTITRKGPVANTASVDFATVAGNATAGTDYVSAAGTIHFAANETVKTIDVLVNGDTANEENEHVFLQLSSPTGVVLRIATAAGTIDDDDPLADLGAEVLQNVNIYGEASRTLKITNNGPSNAYGIVATFTESPFDFTTSNAGDIVCTSTMPKQCTVPFLQPGASTTLTIHRSSVTGVADTSMPPGRTVTLHVASNATDPNPANDTASVMTTGNGFLQLPSKLVTGTSVTATFDLGTPAAVATDVTLTSAASNVVVTPATVRIEAGQRVATFTLDVTAGSEKTVLTATIAGEKKAELVVYVVPPGESPKLAVAIVATNKTSLGYGELFVIPVRIAARYPDGGVPTGLVSLIDLADGSTVQQLTLDVDGAATFTRPQPAPGTYSYRVRYEGDARFFSLQISLAAMTVQKAPALLNVSVPLLACSSPAEVRVTISAADGAPAPTGTVTLRRDQVVYGTYNLTPTGVAGQSGFKTTVVLGNGYHTVRAEYAGDASHAAAALTREIRAGCTQMNLSATATSSTTVAVSWTQPSPGTQRYGMYRSVGLDERFEYVGWTTGTQLVDATAVPGRVYVYYVIGSTNENTDYYYSRPDVASTFGFTDNPLASGMTVKSAHMSEIRALIAALNRAAGLPALSFTGSITPGSPILAQHVTELRTSVETSRARLGLMPIVWMHPNATAGSNVRAATLQELRSTAN